MELYNIDEETYAVAKLQELCNQNLVDLVVIWNSTNSCDNQHFAMQHDLPRELAIHKRNLEFIDRRRSLILKISGNNFPDWSMEQKQPSIGCRLHRWFMSIFSNIQSHVQVHESYS
ncbi:disease resistance protein [Populus alba x Populus x berolinensis]|uniref:Disease resistance protein n=1 Tax=Populus alba x Populus x berolinensis TaxID=444605 RepID=A0AAD6M4B0_9ROSI|nr:disease resistance protein [Populus alba x Populus x berolinensis]